MTIRTKLSLAFGLLGALAILGTGVAAYRQARDILETATFDRLTGLREAKRRQIEAYFDRLRTEVSAFARMPFVADAAQELAAAFEGWSFSEPGRRDASRARVRAYYEIEFGPRLARRSGAPPRLDVLVPTHDPTILLQDLYIASNANETGHKDRLDDAADGSDYSRAHASAHDVFRTLREAQGFYDVFLIDAAQGRVVYSVFKEVDVGTSLLQGPFRTSALADAFGAALRLPPDAPAALVDFATYVPSYGAPASFIAAPVRRDGAVVGVLACQVPIDGINRIMTGGRSWHADGLGASGESYLIGGGGLMRSDSRFMLEDAEGFLGQLRDLGTPPERIERMAAHGTTVLFQPITTDAARTALLGERDTRLVTDYRGVSVLSSFTPVRIPGVDWAVLAEIDAAEAFAPVTTLRRRLLVLAVIAIVAFGLVGLALSETITRPLRRLTDRLEDIARGEGDLTRRVDQARRDEIGTLGRWFNTFVQKVHDVVGSVKHSTLEVTSAATEMAASSRHQADTVRRHGETTDHVAATVAQISEKITALARTMDEVDEVARRSGESARQGAERLQELGGAMTSLDEAMTAFGGKMQTIQDSAARIHLITSTMVKVVDQTNLLSVNATLQAEKAGAAGAGFRVVADEMRRLAEQTAEATLEIEDVVKAMHESITGGSREMAAFREHVQGGVERAELVRRDLGQVVEDVAGLTARFREISGVMHGQSADVGQISASVTELNQGAREISESLAEFTQVADQLQSVVARLRGQVSTFRIEGSG